MSSYIGNEKAELDKNAPLAADAPAAEQYARLLQSVRGARDKLQGNIDTFSTLYSSGVGQTSDDFFASPDQALFVANGGSVFGWAAPNGNNLYSMNWFGEFSLEWNSEFIHDSAFGAKKPSSKS
jgi:hypothetical protein